MEINKKLQLIIEAAKLIESGQAEPEQLHGLIINYVADIESIIPNLLLILQQEREEKKDMITDMNLQLSKSLVAFEHFTDNSDHSKKQRGSIVADIKRVYLKWQYKIKCCFKIKGLP